MITGDMIVDYEMATPEEFLEFYQYPPYSDLEAKVKSLQVNKKEDGIPPTAKAVGIRPTIL